MFKQTLRRALLATVFIASPIAAEATPTSLVEFPPGTFLENMAVLKSGALVFTSYFSKKLHVLGLDNSLSALAELDAHPVSVLRIADGYLIAVHGAPFTSGTGFTKTQKLIHLDEKGNITNVTDASSALFLNGMVQLQDGSVLIADSIAGIIWHYNLADRNLTPWLKHELLSQNPDIQAFVPGANGLKVDGNRLLISNSGRGALYEVSLKDGKSASEPKAIAETGPIDDFWLDGARIIFTTHGDSLKAIEANGTISTLLEKGCDGCTAVTKRGEAYVVLTTGGVLEGHNNPARVLEIPTK